MNNIDLKDILQESLADNNQDYLSILGDEKEMLNDHTDIPDTLPILPLRNTVLFPGVIIPINIGREKSLKLIRYVYKSSAPFGVMPPRHERQLRRAPVSEAGQHATELPDGNYRRRFADVRAQDREEYGNGGNCDCGACKTEPRDCQPEIH